MLIRPTSTVTRAGVVQQIEDRADDPIKKLAFLFKDVKPSWKRFGKGTAEIQFDYHDRADWITIHAVETSHDGAGHQKAVMITLDRADVATLREFLNRMPGGR